MNKLKNFIIQADIENYINQIEKVSEQIDKLVSRKRFLLSALKRARIKLRMI